MNKLICFVALLLLSVAPACAQKAIAKLKFEDAEKAYNEERYNEALSKLNDAEKAFGKVNPPIMHLRILTRDKMLKTMSDPYKEEAAFQLIDALRKDCRTFLAQYGSVEGLEEKYKEVYQIQKSLDAYPATADAWKQQKQKLEQEAIAKMEQQRLKQKQARETDSLTGIMIRNFDIEPSVVATGVAFDAMPQDQRKPLRLMKRGKHHYLPTSVNYYTFNHFISELKPRGNPQISELITDSALNKALAYSVLYMNANDSKFFNPSLYETVRNKLLLKMKQQFPAITEKTLNVEYVSGSKETTEFTYITSESQQQTLLMIAIKRIYPDGKTGTCHIEVFKMPRGLSQLRDEKGVPKPYGLSGTGHNYDSLLDLVSSKW